MVNPGDDLASLILEHGQGTTFRLAKGVYRLGELEPRDQQVFIGEEGAVLSGAKVLSGFRREGEHWVASHPISSVEPRGKCVSDRPACRFSEDLYLDDRLLTRVEALRDVTADGWFFDRDAGLVYLGIDPSSALVELSFLPVAFDGGGQDVVIRGLVIEKYASPAQSAAIAAGQGWTVQGNEIRFNHASGVRVSSGVSLLENYIHQNGQFGVNGAGSGIRVADNEIASNNTVGFSALWAAGGTKFVHTSDLVVEGNLVRDNRGPGLWTDGAMNKNVTYRDNVVLNNAHAGIKHELGGSALIEANAISGNGFAHHVRYRGAGILVRESSGVTIRGNRISGNADALILLHDPKRDPPLTLGDILVESNLIEPGEGVVGYVGGLPSDGFSSGNLRFRGNEYVVGKDASAFLDHGRRVRFAEWISTREPDARRIDPSE